MDGKPAAGEQTVFVGEDVRTGANGVAALNLPVTGVVNVASQTEVSLGGPSLVRLKRGTVAARSFQDGKGLEVEFEAFVVRLAISEGAAAGAVTVGPDGGAKVECLDGALVLARSQGTEAVTLHLGQSVRIDAYGKVQEVEMMAQSAGNAAGQPPQTVPASRKSRAPYLLLGAAATAGGIGAAAALSHKASQPTSPSTP